ncbi:CHAP domain-containing protein [Candidatus Saccharibacteria bacterium]|nr:CHAP domain-containing protein [Candidatus Saccharibacteria bacterium]
MKINKYNSRFSVLSLAVAVAITFGLVVSPMVRADQFDEQIRNLKKQNSQIAGAVNQLEVSAVDFNDKISKLQQQIDALQAQINQSNVEIEQTKTKIAVAEEELAKQRKLLGVNIKAMYLEGQISTVEMLASSSDLSDFFDKAQYRSSVKDTITGTMDRVTALKFELNAQKERLELQKKDQEARQVDLDGQRAEQANLLALNEADRNRLNTDIKNNYAQIGELKRQQLIANARFIGGTAGTGPACGGGYLAKWCEIPQDSVVDDWGMYNRECVSYAAFKVAASGRHMPYWGGYGNANQWDDNARNVGIVVDGEPREGDVAQTDAGGLGHVMYVEHVYGDGTIYISQYNASFDGRYSEKRISAAGLNFIHF